MKLVSFSIHFTSIKSNVSSVDHHFATISPEVFLLSETHLSNNVSTESFLVSTYIYLLQGGVCAFSKMNNKVPDFYGTKSVSLSTAVVPLLGLESSNFHAIWLRIFSASFNYIPLLHLRS